MSEGAGRLETSDVSEAPASGECMGGATGRLRILMFAPQFLPLSNPEAFVNAKLVRAFREHGVHVDVVSRQMVGVERYDYQAAWGERFEALRAVTHETRYPVGPKARRLLETGVGALQVGHPIQGCRWAAHALRVAERLLAQAPYDLVMSRAVPDSAHLPAMIVSRRHRLPWIANWNDPSGRVSPPPYGIGPDAKIDFWQRRFLEAVVREATHLTFPSARLRDYMCQYLPRAARAKSSVVPHVGSGENIPAPVGPSSKFTILYAGSITRERATNARAFFEALARFAAQLPDRECIEFQFVGLDRTGEVARAASASGNLVRILGSVTYEESRALLARADLLLLVEARASESPFFPAKLVDYAEAGPPIFAVTARESTVGDYLRDGGGTAVAGDDAEAILAALRMHHDLWRRSRAGGAVRTGALAAQFAPERVVRLYDALFGSMGVRLAAGRTSL